MSSPAWARTVSETSLPAITPVSKSRAPSRTSSNAGPTSSRLEPRTSPGNQDKAAGGYSAEPLSPGHISREPSVPEVVLGSKNHPEEEDELFGFRKMLRILADPEQHNEKLVHALNVLLAMSLVNSSLTKLVERGTIGSVFNMLRHFGHTKSLFSLDDAHHDHFLSTPNRCFKNPDEHTTPVVTSVESAIEDAVFHSVMHRGAFEAKCRRRPLFPKITNFKLKDEPLLGHLDNTRLTSLSRPASSVPARSSSSSDSASEHDEAPSPLLHASSPLPRISSPATSPGRKSPMSSPIKTPVGSTKRLQPKESSQTRNEGGTNNEAAEDLNRKHGGKHRQAWKKKEKKEFPPPDPAMVLDLSLKVTFNLSREPTSHEHIWQPSHMRFLFHLVSKNSETRLLALRILVNLSSNKGLHHEFMTSPGLLSGIAAALTEVDEQRLDASEIRENAGDLESGNASAAASRITSALSSPLGSDSTSSKPSNSMNEAGNSPVLDSALSSTKGKEPEACKEGEAQFKAMTIICNLSSNDEPAPEAYRVPCMLRLRLLSNDDLEAFADAQGIDKFAFKRHEIEMMLAARRKPTIREKLWEHADVVPALIQTVLHGSHKFRHLILKMFLNFSYDENLQVEMVEGHFDLLEPLMLMMKNILRPLADVLAEKEVEVVEVEEEPVPDRRFLEKVQKFFESRFNSIFDMWIFFDRHDNWSVSVSDVKELSKQLLPASEGVKLGEIALVMDFQKKKILDPHEIIRAIAWHEIPGDGKIVPLTRALDEARSRKSIIMSEIKQKMRVLNEAFQREQKAAQERERKERMANRLSRTHSIGAKGTREAKGTNKERRRSSAAENDADLGVDELERENTKTSNNSPDAKTSENNSPDGISRAESFARLGSVAGVDGLPCTGSGSDGELQYDIAEENEPDDQLQETEEMIALRAEQKHLRQEENKKLKIRSELDSAFHSLLPDDRTSLEMTLNLIRNLCMNSDNHERLVAEVKVIDAIKPLLMMETHTNYPPRIIAHEILDELGEDFEFEESVRFDEETLKRLEVVASKWINGMLLSAFNAWVYAVELLKVHSISILECYKRNCSEMTLPVDASQAVQELKRFLEDETSDVIYLVSKIGVGGQSMKALTFALRGRNVREEKLTMLNVVQLRDREGFLSLAQIDVSCSDMRDEGLDYLVTALLEIKADLLVLKARESNLTSKAGEILKQFLNGCNDVEELWLGRNRLGSTGLKHLCKAVSDHPNMEVLDVSSNGIAAPGGEELGGLLVCNKILKELDCSWNDLIGEDAQQLLQCLCLNTSIEKFRASWNRFGKLALPELRDLNNRKTIFYGRLYAEDSECRDHKAHKDMRTDFFALAITLWHDF